MRFLPSKVGKFFAYLKEKHFSSFFVPCFDFNVKAFKNGFPCIGCLSTFIPFHIWLVHISLIVSSDELSWSLMFWVFREKVKTPYLETF